MSCVIVGPGLVGSYLGIAAGAEAVVTGASGRARARVADLPTGRRSWDPTPCALATSPLPHLVCTRLPDTPPDLPPRSHVVQNGYHHATPVMVPFLAIDHDADGILRDRSPQPRLVLEPPVHDWQPVLLAWRTAGIAIDEVVDVRSALWEKLLLNATVGPLCLITGRSMGEIWKDPTWRRLCISVIEEGCTLAPCSVLGDPVSNALRFFDSCGDHYPSVCTDQRELSAILDPLRHAIAGRQDAYPATTHLLDLLNRVVVG